MRASRQPSVARRASSTSPISGAIASAGASRSLRQPASQDASVSTVALPAAVRRAEDCRGGASVLKTSAVETGRARPDQHQRQRRPAFDALECPRRSRGRGARGRQGTSARRRRASGRSRASSSAERPVAKSSIERRQAPPPRRPSRRRARPRPGCSSRRGSPRAGLQPGVLEERRRRAPGEIARIARRVRGEAAGDARARAVGRLRSPRGRRCRRRPRCVSRR